MADSAVVQLVLINELKHRHVMHIEVVNQGDPDCSRQRLPLIAARVPVAKYLLAVLLIKYAFLSLGNDLAGILLIGTSLSLHNLTCLILASAQGWSFLDLFGHYLSALTSSLFWMLACLRWGLHKFFLQIKIIK